MNVVLFSDQHNGSKTGLTTNPKTKTQESLLEKFKDAIRWAGKPDLLLCMGDMTHGNAEWDHDFEDGKTRLSEQVVDASEICEMWDAKAYAFVSDTPVHGGGGLTSASYLISKMIERAGKKSRFYRKAKLELNGWFRIEARHKIGSSRVPYGRFTMPNRAKIWNVLTSALSSSRTGHKASWPHLCAYGHVHYFTFSKDDFGAVLTCPCWQDQGTIYGDEQCEGLVSIGVVKLEIGKEGEWSCAERLYPIETQRRWVRL